MPTEPAEQRNIDNPANRLVAFIDALTSNAPEAGAGATTGWDTVGALLGVPVGSNRAQVMAALSGLYELVDDIGRSIDRCPEVPQSSKDALPGVRRWLDSMSDNLSNPQPQHPQPDVIVNLRIVGDLLSRHAPEPMPAWGDLMAVREELTSLHTQVLESDVDPNLKSFLVGHLNALIGAIDQFRIRGTAPVRIALVGLVGDAQLTIEAEPATEEGRKLTRRLGEVASRLAVLIIPSATGAAVGTVVTAALMAGH